MKAQLTDTDKKALILIQFRQFFLSQGQTAQDNCTNYNDLSKMSLKRLIKFKQLFNI